MSTLPTLPVELWHQILSYVVTPTKPVELEGWNTSLSKPLLRFASEDADVQKSFTSFTESPPSSFFFPISVPELWRQLITRTTWQLERRAPAIFKIVLDNWPYAAGAKIP